MNPQAIQNFQRELADVSRRIAQARGEHNAIAVRKAELEESVGLAKGRLDRKKDVEKFMEELQAEAHAKRVGDYEKLLSALVMEVLPGEKPVGLELEIERGQPSLDIVSRLSADLSEDIFEDEGGAKTNILVLGLRLLAVVVSGMRRFLVLDEADCWVKNERVPAFYSVVKEAGKKLGTQCFVISHHDTAKFAEGISVARLHGHPENADGVQIENNPRPHRWSDDEDGFRYIRLVNFQGYVDQTLHLYPGVNALIGDNNIGKSSFVRALRAVFYGDGRDRLIRRGESQLTVEIGLREGFILQFVRTAKKNPTWRLLAPNRAVCADEYDTTSRAVPEWVLKDIGIGSIAGLDPHIIKQKTPIFLLDKPGSTRASVLAVGQEASHIRNMVTTYKKMCEQDSALVKTGEAEMARLLEREARIAVAVECEPEIDGLQTLISEIERGVDTSLRIEAVLTEFETLDASLSKMRRNMRVMHELPSAEELRKIEGDVRASIAIADHLDTLEKTGRDIRLNREKLAVLAELPGEVPDIVRSDDIIAIGKAVRDTVVANEGIRERLAILAEMPEHLPTMIDNREVERLLEDIEKNMGQVREARRQRDAVSTEIAKIEREMNELVEHMDHACPLCGGHVENAAAFIGGTHVHAAHSHGEGANV